MCGRVGMDGGLVNGNKGFHRRHLVVVEWLQRRNGAGGHMMNSTTTTTTPFSSCRMAAAVVIVGTPRVHFELVIVAVGVAASVITAATVCRHIVL